MTVLLIYNPFQELMGQWRLWDSVLSSDHHRDAVRSSYHVGWSGIGEALHTLA